MNNIKMIEIEKLYPHPNNPRKDLGDLSELADSIKEKGVLQNLTVIPHEDGYRILIGHRRRTAAALAGLKELPCVITEMDEKDQISTMLLENMQRNDLTAYEQAQGFQMMIEYGESIADIAQKTGLSESTVRHRVKLCELDQKKLQNLSEENINMFDLIKLEKIKDISLRNRVLGHIGTSNFDYSYQQALEEEKRIEKLDEIERLVAEYATKIENDTEIEPLENLETFYSYESLSDIKEDIEEHKQDADTLYYVRERYAVELYAIEKEDRDDEEEPSEAEKEAARQERERLEKLEEISRSMKELRRDFVKGIKITTIKAHKSDLVRFYAEEIVAKGKGLYNYRIAELYDIDREKEEYRGTYGSFDPAIPLTQIAKDDPEKLLFKAAYVSIVAYNLGCKDYRGEYRKNEDLEKEYEFLETYGYRKSDTEEKILNGTHELYQKEEAIDD